MQELGLSDKHTDEVSRIGLKTMIMMMMVMMDSWYYHYYYYYY